MLKGNCIVAQSGGPTSVINSSAYGVISEALSNKNIENIYGAKHGILGVIREELFDLRKEDKKELEYLKTTPSSGLGSCRYKLPNLDEDNSDYIRIFEVFKAHNIRYFFYIGGNDSMDTVAKLNNYAKKINYDIKILGIPKTIDNDLEGTDHCPGFGSAAKYIITSTLECTLDSLVYDANTITIIEVMGRNAGWLAAASALANNTKFDTPDLIYLPEVPFSFEKFKKDVLNVYHKKGKVMIVVSEGIKDENGNYIEHMDSPEYDSFGHSQLGGVGHILGDFLKNNISTKRVKVVQLNILQRSAMHFASKTDIEEAYYVGKKAVQYALEGNSGFLVGIKRISNNPYKYDTKLVEIKKVANLEKKVPLSWINKEGNYVTQECIDYIYPLIQGEVALPIEHGLPRYANLKKELIPKKCIKNNG
ncbi:6-phosphofructokinase [Defluviitalea phaphyphila]|uniref:6-phosphofructokinase n=1 Tax=Defluviitalea phaphyphila TaxID=1473580 RepID=UPI000730CDE8|nr:6-phosphofructokinase [Defluviitalea phaphyphila]